MKVDSELLAIWSDDWAAAPRDGSETLLRLHNGGVHIARWSTHYSVFGLGGCWTDGFSTMGDKIDYSHWAPGDKLRELLWLQGKALSAAPMESVATLPRQEAEAGPVGYVTSPSLRDACATEGCARAATQRLEYGGVGSHFCDECYAKVLALASPSVPEAKVVSGVTVKPLEWSEERKPDATYCQYNHCFADTPFGRYQIEWKGWKDIPGYILTFRDMDFIPAADDLALCKAAAQSDYEQRIRSALSVVEPVHQEGWKPIETAPKDGTKIDVWQHGRRVTDVYWSDIQDWWSFDGMFGPEEPTPLAVAPEPTHWRDLPTPPSSEGVK